jgi:hypothetical protein
MLFLPLLAFAHNKELVAEEISVTVEGRAVISGETSYEEAKSIAITRARLQAIERAAGVTISTATILKNTLMLSQLSTSWSHGWLVSERILHWTGEWAKANNPSDAPLPILSVRLNGTVKVLPKTFFRSYALDANLNKQSYHEGEAISLTIQARANIRLLVVNYTSKGTIVPVFPNDSTMFNALDAGKILRIPASNSDRYRIVARLYPNKKQDTEAFLVFGFPNDSETNSIDWINTFEPRVEDEYAVFFRKLSSLPVKWVAEKTLVYNILDDNENR